MTRPIAMLAAVLIWSGASLTARGAEPESNPVRLSASLQMPDKGFSSYGVYNSDGTLIRSLAAADPVDKGSLTVTWDGTTDLGVPANPGTYTVKGIWFAEPIKTNYVMKVGISGDPPWVLADGLGGWGGNLGCAYDVTSNGKEVIAIFGCVESNLNTGVQRMDKTGRILMRYRTFFGWDNRLAGAMDQEHFYLAIRVRDQKRLVIAKYDLDDPKGKIIADIPAGEHYAPDGELGGMPWLRGAGRWTAAVRGIGLDGGRLYVPVLLDNKLFIVNTDDGQIIKSVDVPSPRGVAARDGKVYLLSETRLMQLDADGAVRKTLIEGLDDPHGVALDPAGNFYISDRGDAQQVKVFSAAGKPLRTIGKEGGRPRNGWYDPNGLLDPAGVAVGPDGDVWVTSTNEDFQRVSVWNGQTGKLKREFFNTRISSGKGLINPDQTEMLFTEGVFADQPGVSAFKVDWEKGTWYPSWHQDMPQPGMVQEQVMVGNSHIDPKVKLTFPNGSAYLGFTDGAIRANNGKVYFYGTDFSIWLFDEKTTELKPAALVYSHRAKQLPDGRFEGDYDRGSNDWLTWSDLNGDAKMSKDEVRFVQNVPGMERNMRLKGVELQPDLSILMLCDLTNGRDKPWDYEVKRLAPREVRPDGVPVYDWSDVQTVTDLKLPSFVGGDGGWKGGELVTLSNLNTSGGDYNIFAAPRVGRGVTLMLPGVDGQGWWASRNWRNSPMRFDPKTGKPAWLKLGRRAPGKAKRGEMYHPWNIRAVIDGLCYVNDTLDQTWVWTDKGLYVGRLYNEFTDQIHDELGIFIESVGAYTYKIDGQVYMVVGDHGVWVHRLDLPRLTDLDGGSVRLTPELSKSAIAWDPDGPPPGDKPTYTARSIYDFQAERDAKRKDAKQARTMSFHRRKMTVDGKLDPSEWDGIEPMRILEEGKAVAEVKVAFDQDTMYLAYDVTDPVGFKNAGTELPYSPFTSGAYVDFSIAPDWSEPQRRENRQGDVRVILAHITGKNAADYQMAFYPLRKAPARVKLNPQTISSPAAQRHFEDISPVNDLKWALQATGKGYTVEVSAPMRPLGISSERNAQVGFDVSVGFANPQGTVRRRALHWAGESEAAVVDRPGSAALLPQTWGTLFLDRDRPAVSDAAP